MPSTTRPRSTSSTPLRNNNNNIGVDEVVPHLQTTLFITGAFCVAWSWDLVVYAISHVWWNEDPLDNQLAFGDQHGPKYLGIMLLQYLVVCGAAAAMSNRFRRHQGEGWYDAAVMAVEFFPSPVFAGKLMAYLGQFSFPPVHQALLNLAATWFAAFLAHLASSSVNESSSVTIGFWQRTGLIVRDTLGFGLGIAWNVLLAQFGPNSYSRLDVMHFLALLTYLLLVLVMALKLAAIVPDKPVTIWDRHLSLLAFAMYVVCGFTLVGFLSALLGNGWIGSLESFGIVLVLAAIMSTMVAVADLDGLLASAEEQGGYGDVENNTNESTSWEYKPSKFGAFGGILNCLIFVPCVWCCCPWVPLLILLAGMTESINVKEHWFKLIAMVGGLASSIEGSGMLTSATDALAEQFGICHHGRCYQPWMFVALQVGMAMGCTMVILPMIAPLAPSQSSGRTVESSTAPSATTSLDVDDSSPIPPPVPAPSAPTEEQPLLLYGVPPMAPPPVNPNYDPYRM